MRRHRSDLTQASIVAALRAAGFMVYPIGEPCDLLTWRADKGWLPLECKTGRRKRKDQPVQAAFLQLTAVPVVRTAQEALRAVGAITRRPGSELVLATSVIDFDVVPRRA